MKFKLRKYSFKGGEHVKETRRVNIALVIGVLIVIMLIYFLG